MCLVNQKHTRIYQTGKGGTFCEDCMYVNVKLDRIPNLHDSVIFHFFPLMIWETRKSHKSLSHL